MSMGIRSVYCAWDEEGVFVYQALSTKIVEVAVLEGTFGKGFGLDRTSWIKPSLAWTLHRSDYATKHRMEAIAQIKLHHWAWLEILDQAVQSHYDPHVYATEWEWQRALKATNVVCQWDPERALDGRPLGRQAIQLGLRAPMLHRYVKEFIHSVCDLTPMARSLDEARKGRRASTAQVPIESPYPLPQMIMQQLGCTE